VAGKGLQSLPEPTKSHWREPIWRLAGARVGAGLPKGLGVGTWAGVSFGTARGDAQLLGLPSAELPLPAPGASVHMDGAALHGRIGLIFLAQYFASSGHFELSLRDQVLVVALPPLASVGAGSGVAGVPSAGLKLRMGILITLEPPIEGAALLRSVGRPTVLPRRLVKVW